METTTTTTTAVVELLPGAPAFQHGLHCKYITELADKLENSYEGAVTDRKCLLLPTLEASIYDGALLLFFLSSRKIILMHQFLLFELLCSFLKIYACRASIGP